MRENIRKRQRKIIRRRQVREITGLADRTIDRRESLGDFPRRVRLGQNAIGWFSDEVEEWVEARERGGCESPMARAG